MVDCRIHSSNALILATSNASCIDALHLPILFQHVPASYTIMSAHLLSIFDKDEDNSVTHDGSLL